jgi:hypothetical protein
MKARPFSPYLQRLEFMEPEYCEGFYRSIARMTVLVPPDIVNFWASEPDNTVEKFGKQIVFIEIMRVCEREGLLPPALLEGRARRFPAALANHLSL